MKKMKCSRCQRELHVNDGCVEVICDVCCAGSKVEPKEESTDESQDL